MDLSSEDVEKVAKLAKLKFSSDELPVFAEQMTNIVHFVETLEEVDTHGIVPMSHPLDVQSVSRQDVALPCLPRDEALKNSPASDGQFFLVPAVLGPKK